MTPSDLARLHAICFTSPRPWSEAEFSEMLASKTTQLHSVNDGFLLGRVAGPEAEILTLAVAPDNRRKGLARILLARFETALKAGNTEQIFLEVAEANHPAIALYRAAGFRDAGYRKDYYDGNNGQKSAALVMVKALLTS